VTVEPPGVISGDVPPGESHRARIRTYVPRDEVEHGGLAGPVGSDQSGDRALIDLEGTPVDGPDSAEPLAQSIDRQHGTHDLARADRTSIPDLRPSPASGAGNTGLSDCPGGGGETPTADRPARSRSRSAIVGRIPLGKNNMINKNTSAYAMR
jgi:hypothetical protein